MKFMAPLGLVMSSALPLPEGSADTVILHQVLHFAQQPEAAVSYLKAALEMKARHAGLNLVAAEPESQVRMQPLGRRGESSQNTRCGLSGFASFMARA